MAGLPGSGASRAGGHFTRRGPTAKSMTGQRFARPGQLWAGGTGFARIGFRPAQGAHRLRPRGPSRRGSRGAAGPDEAPEEGIMRKLLAQLARGESGQDLIEYALLVAFLATVSVLALNTLGGSLASFYQDLQARLSAM